MFQRADGLWVGRVDFGFDNNGKRMRKNIYGKTRKLAQEKLQSLLAEKRRGLVEPTTATVTGWITQYLDDAKSRLRCNHALEIQHQFRRKSDDACYEYSMNFTLNLACRANSGFSGPKPLIRPLTA